MTQAPPAHPVHSRQTLSITLQLLVLTLVLSALLGGVWGRIHIEGVRESLRENFSGQLIARARDSRIRLDNYVKFHHYAAELFLTQRKFIDYLETHPPPSKLIQHGRTPAWFPDRSIQRTFIKARHTLLLDQAGNIREMFSRGGKKVPGELLEKLLMHRQLPKGKESRILQLGEVLYLMTLQSISKEVGEEWGWLVLATPMDDRFLLASQGLVSTTGLLGLVDMDTHRILVSGDIEQIPVGTPVDQLDQRFVVQKEAFFDYGNSEVILKLVMLAPLAEFQELMNEVSREALVEIVLVSFAFSAIFSLVILWFLHHLQNFTGEMQSFARNRLGLEFQIATRGGPLNRMREQFSLMAENILAAREREAEHNQELKETNSALNNSLQMIKRTQSQLLQSEKMAALGGLVAGIAHEINTPVGIGYTTATHLEGVTRQLKNSYKESQLKRSELEDYLDTASESSQLIAANLRRAADLIGSFKRVAVDQTSEKRRTLRVKPYFEEVLLSLGPKLKNRHHTITLNCPEALQIDSFPGALSQILSNLIINSLDHAFSEKEEGKIEIEVSRKENFILFCYRDSGRGMEADSVKRIFEPFYTTARGRGGSGLGMHIVFNLVTQTLGGTIHCHSRPGEGTTFDITIPMT
ncbi:MAG: HAMP domain-containing histidine kinase [Magnetococcales bacterium]|nr:HAMP domain-containing histidine kinase [Magnetococcales bacterium]